MTAGNLLEINAHVMACSRETEKEVLKRKIVEDDHAAVLSHRIDDARMIPMVVTEVVQDSVEAVELSKS